MNFYLIESTLSRVYENKKTKENNRKVKGVLIWKRENPGGLQHFRIVDLIELVEN